jgi:hypothetical protein
MNGDAPDRNPAPEEELPSNEEPLQPDGTSLEEPSWTPGPPSRRWARSCLYIGLAGFIANTVAFAAMTFKVVPEYPFMAISIVFFGLYIIGRIFGVSIKREPLA